MQKRGSCIYFHSKLFSPVWFQSLQRVINMKGRHFYNFLLFAFLAVFEEVSVQICIQIIKESKPKIFAWWPLIISYCNVIPKTVNTREPELLEDFLLSIELFLALPSRSQQLGCNMLINRWHQLNRNITVQDEKTGINVGFAIQDRPLDHTAPYPTNIWTGKNKIHVIPSDANDLSLLAAPALLPIL